MRNTHSRRQLLGTSNHWPHTNELRFFRPPDRGPNHELHVTIHFQTLTAAGRFWIRQCCVGPVVPEQEMLACDSTGHKPVTSLDHLAGLANPSTLGIPAACLACIQTCAGGFRQRTSEFWIVQPGLIWPKYPSQEGGLTILVRQQAALFHSILLQDCLVQYVNNQQLG